MMKKSEVRSQKSEVRSQILLTSVLCFLTSVSCFTGCANKSNEEAMFAKGYYKDRGALSPGTSEGVGPTQKKITAEKILDLGRRETKEYDFADNTSSTLTIKAWEALNKKDEKGVLVYTQRCIELYEQEAKKQAKTLTDFADTNSIDMYKDMNNVSTCYFIKGEFFKYQKNWPKAIESYKALVDNFPFAQYWDPRGWYWRPAEIAKDEIRKINEGYYK